MLSKTITSKLKGIFSAKDPSTLEKEIQSILDAGEEDGLIDSQSGEMIQSILEFRETVVREVMIPRTDIIAVQSDAPIEEIIDLITRFGHTRIPVFSGSIDNIVGILNVKDLLKFWSRSISGGDILSILRKPYYIPETKNTHLLLHELKQRKYHMAVVIDEYGGTSGLVTLEDLVEEIVGEIPDEHDVNGGEIVDLPDGYTMVDGRTDIEKIDDHFGVTLPEGKYETLAGLILHTLGKIPATGEQMIIKPFEINIEFADERSIKKVRMKRLEGSRDDGEARE